MPKDMKLWWSVSALIGLGGIVVLVMLSMSASANPAVSQHSPCDGDLSQVPDDVAHACYVERSTAMAERLQAEMTQAPLYPTAPAPTSLPPSALVLTPGSVPEDMQHVERLEPSDFADGPVATRGSTSIWRLGGLANPERYSYGTIYLLSRPPREGLWETASLHIAVSGSSTEEQRHVYSSYWAAPSDIDMIEITNVHGVVIHPDRIEGTATFTTATGRLGSVDLATMEVQLAPPPDDR